MPTFSLVYTSARPKQIVPVIEEWVRKCRNATDIEVVVVVDGKDQEGQRILSEPRPWPCAVRAYVQPDPPFNCVRGWNLGASKVTGKVLIQLTDDMVPPDAWDVKLKALDPANWIDQDWAIHVEDGYVHDIMVLAVITKVRYDRFGYFFYPDYESLFSDTELTKVAYLERRVIVAKHLLFEHRHPDCAKRERDEVDLVHASKDRWTRGELLFNYRKAHGFPIDVGPNARKEEPLAEQGPAKAPALKFAVYIQATKDDLCLFEVCKRMMEEGVNDFFYSVPDEFWSGRPTPQENIEQIKKVAAQIKSIGGNVELLIHDVSTYRWPGDTRIRVETRVRNDALGCIRGRGFEHVLIVDGDELWRRGTLKYVEQVISQFHPLAINCLMVPVAGLPGYPIDGATDVAVIYVNSGVPFKECRTPVCDQFRIQMPLVIHFTGTRRTMEETIQKHKDSGHYDDPDYKFDEWVEKVLPNFKPGFTYDWGNGVKGVHMFTRYSIWPRVRGWMAEEIAEIPTSVHQYLGLPKS